jgi:hypothetical protein
MARLTMPRIRPLSRKEWISTSIVGGLILCYFIGLKIFDNRAETYFRETRTSNPELYLEQLRDLHGFNAYLPEYAVIKKFEVETPRTPEFITGRWTMRDAPMRLTAGTYPEQCSNQITFDYGIILMVEPGATTMRVTYRIADGKVIAHTPTGSIFAITPVSFGAQVDHIEFVPPGRINKVYAYFCGG